MFELEINEKNIKKADIAVGLPSYNEADSIANPTLQSDIGLQKYFSNYRCVIINCDNHSPDNTKDAFLNTKTKTPKIYITTPPNTPGKGYNFENLFRKALELKVKVLICIDADLISITPEWIKYFADAILDGYDYVTPIYSRHKYDGTITNNICYPLVYGLLGYNIRQPIGGDFALSSNFFEYIIKQMWHRTTKQYGIDIFLTLNAILGGFRISEVGLGSKIHKPSAPKLGPMFTQVVNTIFLLISKYIHKWKDINYIKTLPLFGLRELAPPQDLKVNKDDILKRGLEDFNKSSNFLKNRLPKLYEKISNLIKNNNIKLLDKVLWCDIVYNLIALYSQSKELEEREKVIDSLRGLYFLRVYSFMEETWDMDSLEAEKLIVDQCKIFFDKRDDLINKLIE